MTRADLLARVRATLEALWDCTCAGEDEAECERCTTLRELDDLIGVEQVHPAP